MQKSLAGTIMRTVMQPMRNMTLIENVMTLQELSEEH